MKRKESPQSVIDSYRRRQQMTPVYMAGLAILLVVAGIIILVLWFQNNNAPGKVAAVEASPTAMSVTDTAAAAATETQVPPTATETLVPTETLSPTPTETATPAGPFEYVVQEGDTCWDLAVKNKVNPDVLLAINNFQPGTCPIQSGGTILIPLPDTQLPTETPIASDLRGKIDYYVKTNETLAEIALRFNSTVDAIVKENKITDVNKIAAGAKLVIPVNIVTPVPTKAATPTNTPGGPTETPVQETPTATPTT
jgi:LysM repeat protein